MDFINSGVGAVCDGLDIVGIECGAQIVTVRLGHLLFIALFVALFLGLLRVTIWRKRSSRGYLTIPRLSFEGAAVTGPEAVYINPHDLADVMGRNDLLSEPKTRVEEFLRPNFKGKYFVVEIIERGKTLMRSEMRVMPRAWSQERGDARIDPATMETVRFNNASIDDNAFEGDPKAGVYGSYKVSFRPVRMWDIGHWLTHPNREIRLALWVAIIAVTIEYAPDVVELLATIWRSIGAQ